MDAFGIARALAERAHRDQLDRFGHPLIDHAVRVAERVRQRVDRGVVAAVLHDAIEKGALTLDDLRDAGLDPATVALVDIVTRHPAETELHYLRRCADDPLAAIIKEEDLLDKLEAGGISTLSPIEATALLDEVAQRLATLGAARSATGGR